MKRQILVCVCALIVLGSYVRDSCGATVRNLQIEAHKLANSYRIVARTFGSQGGSSDELRNPLGQLFPVGTEYTRSYSTFAEFQSALFGEWILTSETVYDETYKFSISPFALAEVTIPEIKILSPLNGSQVTSPFLIDFSTSSGAASLNASGVRPTGPGREIEGEYSFIVVSPRARITIEAQSRRQSFSDRISPISYTGPQMRFDLLPSLDFRFVDVVTVTPVPEPATDFCMATGLLFAGVFATRTRNACR